MLTRYLSKHIEKDLQEKMIFLSGPRQVGKTTLALSYLKPPSSSNTAYMNWDSPGISKKLLQGFLPESSSLIVLDEIHKYARWRNLVKGIYDQNKDKYKFLVTGSARLDHYRKGGDSLQGRYFHYRLHPLSLNEISSNPSPDTLKTLLKFGGFPEVFFKGSEVFWKKWQKAHLSRVVREDLRDLEYVREISLVETLAETLPSRVGSPLSISNLKNDLQIDHKTAVRWISILEALYYCFRIAPYGSPKIKAVKKEQKLYLWDWSLVEGAGPRFENFVASHLLKFCHFREDVFGETMELRFLKDKEKREVDFVLIKDKKPWMAIECKTGPKALSPALKYYKERTPIQEFYQVHADTESWSKDGFSCLGFAEFCKRIGIP